MSFLDRITNPFMLIVLLGLIAACSQPNDSNDGAIDTPMDPLVTAQWLSEHLNDSDLVVLDCTVLVQPSESGGFSVVNGRAHYEEGHIPTAGFADLMGDLSDGDSPFQFAVPTPERFA